MKAPEQIGQVEGLETRGPEAHEKQKNHLPDLHHWQLRVLS